jgi:hypothetical protein
LGVNIDGIGSRALPNQSKQAAVKVCQWPNYGLKGRPIYALTHNVDWRSAMAVALRKALDPRQLLDWARRQADELDPLRSEMDDLFRLRHHVEEWFTGDYPYPGPKPDWWE